MKRQVLVRLFCLWFFSLTLSVAAISTQAAGRNILMIIADDLGVDMLSMYGRGSDIPPTPNIDALKAKGVMFRNAWSNPYCSPTRATIQTGQYSLRTGVGTVVLESTANGLPLADPAIRPIPRVLNQYPALGYSHAVIGKWHLSNTASSLPDPTGVLPNRKIYAPNDAGWSHFSGNWSYMGGVNVDGGPDNYFSWQKLEDGARTAIGNPLDPLDPSAYVTTVNVDDAVRWVGQQSGPWFLYLAFNSPHFPYHAPPPGLLNPPRDVTGGATRVLYKAMIEAMDTEIGRLVRTLGPTVMANTTVIFLGDNGTPGIVVAPPFYPQQAKGSLYDGGINVPLIISGAGVKNPNRESLALVNTTDLYTTALDLAGVDLGAALSGMKLDAVSLKPILSITKNPNPRKYMYAELFAGPTSNWIRAARNSRYKLIRTIPNKSYPDLYLPSDETFYHLASDPFEQTNLLLNAKLTTEQQKNLTELRAYLNALK